MDVVYWTCLVVGGISVLLSAIGGGDVEADADVDVELDMDADLDAELDTVGGAGAGWVDLLSLRTVLLFAAFFGLSGVLLPLAGVSEVTRLVLSSVTGLTIGMGGNWIIKRIGYEHVSSSVADSDLRGHTARVLIPFDHTDKGKITLHGKGRRIQLVAESYEEAEEVFSEGDEVVVVRVTRGVAEVVKPS